MDKFTIKSPSYRINNKYFSYKDLSFFMFQGKAYPVGSRVELNQHGKNMFLLCPYSNEYAISECYFCNQNLIFSIVGLNNKKETCKNDGYAVDIEYFIERVVDAPIDDDWQEYIDYINQYTEKMINENYTQEEQENINYSEKTGIPLENLDPNLPEKVSRVEKAKRESCYEHKNKHYISIIPALIILIIICFFFGIFAKFSDRFILSMIAIVGFFMWSDKKIMGG